MGRAIIGLSLYMLRPPVFSGDMKIRHHSTIKTTRLLSCNKRASILTILFSRRSLRKPRNLRIFPRWMPEMVTSFGSTCSPELSIVLSSKFLYSLFPTAARVLQPTLQQIISVYTISSAIWQIKTPQSSSSEMSGGSSAITRNTNTLMAPTSRNEPTAPYI